LHIKLGLKKNSAEGMDKTYEKVEPRQVDLKYVGRLLLDNEEGCT
jgi:hypothetical protein